MKIKRKNSYLVPQNTVPSGEISNLWLFTVTWCIDDVTELMNTVSGVQMMSDGCLVPTMMVSVLFKGCFRRWSFHVCRKNISTVYIYWMQREGSNLDNLSEKGFEFLFSCFRIPVGVTKKVRWSATANNSFFPYPEFLVIYRKMGISSARNTWSLEKTAWEKLLVTPIKNKYHVYRIEISEG